MKGPKVDTASLPTAKPEVSTNGNGAVSDHAQTHVNIRQPPLTHADHVANNQDLEVDSVLAKELNDNGEGLLYHLQSLAAWLPDCWSWYCLVASCVDSTGGHGLAFIGWLGAFCCCQAISAAGRGAQPHL